MGDFHTQREGQHGYKYDRESSEGGRGLAEAEPVLMVSQGLVTFCLFLKR